MMGGRRAGRGLRRRAARTRERRRGDGVGGDWVRAVSVVGGGRVGSARGVRRRRDVAHVDARGLLPPRTWGKKRPSSGRRVGPRRAEGGVGVARGDPTPSMRPKDRARAEPGARRRPRSQVTNTGSLGVARNERVLWQVFHSRARRERRAVVLVLLQWWSTVVFAATVGVERDRAWSSGRVRAFKR